MFFFSNFAGCTIVVFDELLNRVSFEQYFSSTSIKQLCSTHKMAHKNQKSNKFTGGPTAGNESPNATHPAAGDNSQLYEPCSPNELSLQFMEIIYPVVRLYLLTRFFGCKHFFFFFIYFASSLAGDGQDAGNPGRERSSKC